MMPIYLSAPSKAPTNFHSGFEEEIEYLIEGIELFLEGSLGHQVMASTFGDLIFSRKITGVRSTQWLGQMSDISLQQLSRDRKRAVVEHGTQQQTRIRTPFEDRYGQKYVESDKINISWVLERP